MPVRIRYCSLLPVEHSDAGLVEEWIERLEKLCSPEATVYFPPDGRPDYSQRVIWAGEPFLIAGGAARLDVFLDELDEESARIVKDCGYCWFLSDSAELTHDRLPAGRPVVLNWQHHEQNIIRDSLKILGTFPNLRGLSRSTDRIRREIVRIASGTTGPSHSVLILGPSGCGKELVFQSLIESSERSGKPTRATGGAWLNMEPGMAMTELVGIERGKVSWQTPGLLQLFSEGSLFIDDFESAPRYIQETLLRIMEDENGQYFSVGAATPRYTRVWMLFATNQDLEAFLQKKELRRDFFYRFGARIISIPPLVDRPADVPAIAQALWNSLWRRALRLAPGQELPSPRDWDDPYPPPLGSEAIRALMAADIDWEGNTRTLRAALDLVISMIEDPDYNEYSQGDLVGLLLAKGRSPIEWVRVLGPKTDQVPPTPLEEQIRGADTGHPRELGPSAQHEDPLETNLTPSEAQAKARLTPEGWERFKRLCRAAPQTGDSRFVRVSVRFARIIWYVALSRSITWRTAARITGVGEGTARPDLAALSDPSDGLIGRVPDSRPSAYERTTMFQQP